MDELTDTIPVPEQRGLVSAVRVTLLDRLRASIARITAALVPVLLAVAAAGGSYWLLKRIAAEDEGPMAERRLPDYWMDGVRRTKLDATGQVDSVLNAARLEHFPGDDSTELEAPRLALYNGQPAPWLVNAERAWASGDGEVVELLGPVEIFRLDEAGDRRYEVLTSDMKVLPNDQYAETAKPVTINAPRTVTTAVGMRANFSQNRLELLGDVKTRYEPPP